MNLLLHRNGSHFDKLEIRLLRTGITSLMFDTFLAFLTPWNRNFAMCGGDGEVAYDALIRSIATGWKSLLAMMDVTPCKRAKTYWRSGRAARILPCRSQAGELYPIWNSRRCGAVQSSRCGGRTYLKRTNARSVSRIRGSNSPTQWPHTMRPKRATITHGSSTSTSIQQLSHVNAFKIAAVSDSTATRRDLVQPRNCSHERPENATREAGEGSGGN